MTKERFKLISAVYCIFEKDGEVLLQRRSNTGYEDGKYSFVAGHLDGNETARATLVREVKEETGVEVDEGDLQHAVTLHRWCGDHERIELFFVTQTWTGQPQIMEPHKHDNVSWFPIGALSDNVIPYIHSVLEAYQKGETYIEFGWDNKK